MSATAGWLARCVLVVVARVAIDLARADRDHGIGAYYYDDYWNTYTHGG